MFSLTANTKSVRILLLENNPDGAPALKQIKAAGVKCAAHIVSDWEHFRELASRSRYDVLVGEYELLEPSGPQAMQELRRSGVASPVILLTGGLGDELVAACMREGAVDCILKDRLDRLPAAVLRVVDEDEDEAEERTAQGRAEPARLQSKQQCASLIRSSLIRSALDGTSRQNQKMESVGKLAGGLLHDFNNLLMIIRGSAELLQVHMNNPAKASRYIEQIQDATSVAASGVLRLMVLTRGEAAEAGIVDLNLLLDDIAQMLPRLLGEQIQIDFKREDAPGLVRANRNEMEQVTLLLALSAADAMPRGGTLYIETSHVAVDDTSGDSTNLAPGEYMRLTVADAKVLKARPQSLQPFLAGSNSKSGTGLGLAAAHSIVKQGGGDIVVQYIPGYGNIFKAFFPVVVPVEVGKPPQRIAAPAKNTGTFPG